MFQKFCLLGRAINQALLWGSEFRRPTVMGLHAMRSLQRQLWRLICPIGRRERENAWGWKIRHTAICEDMARRS
eukprot:8930055-Alexandrium_andersonii.AAC.1